MKDKPLKSIHWAVICTIHQEPKYKFVGSEFRLAERMVKLGLLEPKSKKHYGVTPYGEACYKADKLLAVN